MYCSTARITTLNVLSPAPTYQVPTRSRLYITCEFVRLNGGYSTDDSSVLHLVEFPNSAKRGGINTNDFFNAKHQLAWCLRLRHALLSLRKVQGGINTVVIIPCGRNGGWSHMNDVVALPRRCTPRQDLEVRLHSSHQARKHISVYFSKM